MEITIRKEAKYLHCYIHPRFLDMAGFNDVRDDEDGKLAHEYLPEDAFVSKDELIKLDVLEECAEGFIRLVINLDNGTIEGWKQGVTAVFNYKSSDENVFVLTDEEGDIIHKTYSKQRGAGTEYHFGPDFLQNSGDYFCPTIDGEGKIKNYDATQMKNDVEYWVNDITRYFKEKNK